MKVFARIAAAAIGGIIVTMTLVQMQQPTAPVAEVIAVPLEESGYDPVRAELRRCQALGAAGADDRRCLNAWATMRSRFFMASVKANRSLAEADNADTEVESSVNEADVPANLETQTTDRDN